MTEPEFENARKLNLLIRIYSIVLGLTGLVLLGGGVYLITLGGSWYYALAGAGLALSAILTWRGRLAGVSLYMLVFLATILWSVWRLASLSGGWFRA